MHTEMDDRLRAEMFGQAELEFEGGDTKPLLSAIAEVQWALRVTLDAEVAAGSRGYKYATLPAIWRVLRPLLQENRLLLQQLDVTTLEHRGKYCRCLTRVTHVDSGASVSFRTWTTMHEARIMNSTQLEGSVFSYARKRAAFGFFGIAPEDLDGNEQPTNSGWKECYVDSPWLEFTFIMRGAEMNGDIFRDFVMSRYGQDPVDWSRDRLKRTFHRLRKGQYDTVIQWQLDEGEE